MGRKTRQDLWEAIQLYHLATNIILIESNGHLLLRALDQLFYPFYKRWQTDQLRRNLSN